jgi:hypothetical protein
MTDSTDLLSRTVTILRLNGPRWHALASGLDRELLARRPAEGEWSALECLGHTVDTEAAIFAERVRRIRDGLPELPPYDPDTQGTPITDATDPVDLAERHAGMRAASIELVASLREADLDKTSVHGELGVVSLRELLNEWWAHDTMHLVQAERALMQPFVAGSGPWRFYFADHDVEAAAGR